MSKQTNILIIDGSYHLFRYYFGVPQTAALPDGTRVNAVYGFFAYLRRVVGALDPTDIYAVFDSEGGTREKTDAVPDYKADRTLDDTGMFDQLPIIQAILRYLNIPVVEHPDHEGDDVISTIAAGASAHADNVYIATNDHDFLQVVNETISIAREYRGKQILINQSNIKEYSGGVLACQYPSYLALKGDVSDNLKGIPGIGPVTALKLLTEYGCLKEIIANLHQLPEQVRNRFAGYEEEAIEMTQFFTMKRDIPLGAHWEPDNGAFLSEKLHCKTNDLLKAVGYEESFVTS